MTKDEALKMAHKSFMQLNERHPRRDNGNGYFDEEIKACKEALDTPECNPHPKAPHGFCRNASHSAGRYVCECEGWELEWQGLSEDEVQKCYEKNTGAWVGFYDQIEQALKEKNT